MERINVSSSNMVSIGYDEERKILEIEFKGGRIYQYSQILPYLHKELMNASSKGSFFHQHIKEAFPTTRII